MNNKYEILLKNIIRYYPIIQTNKYISLTGLERLNNNI